MCDLIEAMARAIYRSDTPSFKDADFDKLDSILQAQFKGLATAALAALRETHHVVPKATHTVTMRDRPLERNPRCVT